MTEFELLAIPIALVLGLGVTQILSDVTEAVRGRHEAPLHWVPLAWAFLIFLFQVTYFFVLWDIDERLVLTGRTWTVGQFWPAFFHAVLLFLGAGLILPSRRRPRADLLDDFRRHGRLALVPLGLAMVVAVPLNALQHDAPWHHPANVLNVMLTAAISVAYFSSRMGWLGGATVVAGLVELYGIAFVWSEPGNPPG